jgi:hypothetical protein
MNPNKELLKRCLISRWQSGVGPL